MEDRPISMFSECVRPLLRRSASLCLAAWWYDVQRGCTVSSNANATSLPPLLRSCFESVFLFSRPASALCYIACPSTYPEHPVSSWLDIATAPAAALPCIYPSAMTAIAIRPALGIISQHGRAKTTLSCRSLAARKQCKDISRS